MTLNLSEFQTLRNTSSRLLDHFCNKEIYSNNLLDEYLINLISNQLASSYSLLGNNLPILSGNNLKEINLKNFDTKDYESSYLSPVVDLYHHINSTFSDIFDIFCIHGSISSLDYVEGWSDLDTFAVVNKDLVQSASGLRKLREAIREINQISTQICSLQHHGVNIHTPYEIAYYDESNLPSEIFSEFKVLSKRVDHIEIYPQESENNSKKRIKNVLSFLIQAHQEGIMKTHGFNQKYLASEYKNADDAMYQFKYFLEQFTLLPALYLGVNGDFCYKRDSFQKIEDYFSPLAIDFIAKISFIRQEWANREGVEYIPNNIPSWVREIIPINYFEIGYEIAEEVLQKIK